MSLRKLVNAEKNGTVFTVPLFSRYSYQTFFQPETYKQSFPKIMCISENIPAFLMNSKWYTAHTADLCYLR